MSGSRGILKIQAAFRKHISSRMAPSSKKSVPNPDEAECNKELGKPPPQPPQPPNVMAVSDSVVQRIHTGAVDEERLTAYDNYWLDKLACMDMSHTKRNKLDENEIQKLLRFLKQYAKTGNGKTCPVDRRRIVDCYIQNHGQTLKCSSEVLKFTDCVDKMLYQASHDDVGMMATIASKKMTYAEQFKKSY